LLTDVVRVYIDNTLVEEALVKQQPKSTLGELAIEAFVKGEAWEPPSEPKNTNCESDDPQSNCGNTEKNDGNNDDGSNSDDLYDFELDDDWDSAKSNTKVHMMMIA